MGYMPERRKSNDIQSAVPKAEQHHIPKPDKIRDWMMSTTVVCLCAWRQRVGALIFPPSKRVHRVKGINKCDHSLFTLWSTLVRFDLKLFNMVANILDPTRN